jgi:hypothetical protein
LLLNDFKKGWGGAWKNKGGKNALNAARKQRATQACCGFVRIVHCEVSALAKATSRK